MQLSDEAIKELQQIIFDDYDKTLSIAEAIEMGTRLTNLYRPVYESWINKKWKAVEDQIVREN